ncbi:MAG: zinc-binding dehydrogenase [Actinomycetota bacterium]|nr:zinc-binding dehydrogenase [Actinomycetota bacterium]
MRALVFERSIPRYAAARVAATLAPGLGSRVGPLTLSDIDEPELPAPGWHRVRPRLAGICGSDLSTVDGKASAYFEPLVSFPFVPGHEVVGELDDGTRVVVEPVLGCTVRGVVPPCGACAGGHIDRCERLAFGHLAPGMQTGYCTDTGGGWSTALVAHESQIHRVPDAMSDEAAVMVEPAACAVHAAVGAGAFGRRVLVLGAGTVGLCATAALRRFASPSMLMVAAKHPLQRRLAAELGADLVVGSDEVRRAVRRTTASLRVGSGLSGGVDVVIDCVGNQASLAEDLAVVAPGGTIVLLGMPATVVVDLTPLWQRQITLRGSYAYGVEDGHAPGVEDDAADNGAPPPRTFDLAFDLVAEVTLERLVSATYPLDRYRDAIDHAANAGRRDAVKVAFDLRSERRR